MTDMAFATANKALVLDGSLDIAGINDDVDTLLILPISGDRFTVDYRVDYRIEGIELCHPQDLIDATFFIGTYDEMVEIIPVITNETMEGVNITTSIVYYENIIGELPNITEELPDEYNTMDISNAIVVDIDVTDSTSGNITDAAYVDISMSNGSLDVSTLNVYKIGYGFLPEVENVSSLPLVGGNASFCRECYYDNTITIRLYAGDLRIALLPQATKNLTIQLKPGWNLVSFPLSL